MAPKKNYSAEQMNKAIQEVGRGVNVTTAAKKFGVPRITHSVIKLLEKVRLIVEWVLVLY